MSRLVDLALGGLALLLVAAIGLELAPVDTETGADIVALRPHRAAPAPAAPDRTDAWAQTALARPLFNPTRRPPPDAAHPAGPPQQLAAMPRLAGILIGPDGGRAIFAPEGGKPLVLRVGDRIAGATINAIGNGAVTVQGPDGQSALRPSFSHAPPPVAAGGFRLPTADVAAGADGLPVGLPGLVAAPDPDGRPFAPVQTPSGNQP